MQWPSTVSRGINGEKLKQRNILWTANIPVFTHSILWQHFLNTTWIPRFDSYMVIVTTVSILNSHDCKHKHCVIKQVKHDLLTCYGPFSLLNIQCSVLFCDTVLICVTVFLLCIVLFIFLELYCVCLWCMCCYPNWGFSVLFPQL
jgi:hypothetical protein